MKKNVLSAAMVVLACTACTKKGEQLATPPPKNYVALYSFEGNGQDESKYRNHGQLNGVQFAKGVKGQCVWFIAKNKSFMRVPFPPQLNFAKNSDFSIHFFVKFGLQTDLNVRDNYIVSMSFMANSYPWALRILNQKEVQNPLSFYFARYDECKNDPILGSPMIGDEKWHSVAAVKNGVELSLFVDGYPVGKPVVDRTQCNTQNYSDIYIGGEHPLQTRVWFDGSLDELAFFDFALSDAQVLALSTDK